MLSHPSAYINLLEMDNKTWFDFSRQQKKIQRRKLTTYRCGQNQNPSVWNFMRMTIKSVINSFIPESVISDYNDFFKQGFQVERSSQTSESLKDPIIIWLNCKETNICFTSIYLK